MSDNIPLEIQVEIIKRVPVKSLIQFRCVSKQWKSLIDSREFIADHVAKPHHLLVSYTVDSKDEYVSIADDDSFPHHKFSPIVPPTVKLLTLESMLDCSQGLVCLSGVCKGKKLIVLWNPSIRRSVDIAIPDELDAVGFGVSPRNSDPKIIAVTHDNSPTGNAKVYTLSSGAWRSITMNLRWSSVNFSHDQVVIDGVIYWTVFDKNYESCRLGIISFDLTSEEFSEVDLPDSLAHAKDLFISNLKGSLVVLIDNEAALVYDVWMRIKTGDPNSRFTKLFTASFNRKDDTLLYTIIGFRNNGQMITEHVCQTPDLVIVTTLEVYESSLEDSNHLPVYVAYNSYIMKTSYTESLLLLNHSDSIVQ